MQKDTLFLNKTIYRTQSLDSVCDDSFLFCCHRRAGDPDKMRVGHRDDRRRRQDPLHRLRGQNRRRVTAQNTHADQTKAAREYQGFRVSYKHYE